MAPAMKAASEKKAVTCAAEDARVGFSTPNFTPLFTLTKPSAFRRPRQRNLTPLHKFRLLRAVHYRSLRPRSLSIWDERTPADQPRGLSAHGEKRVLAGNLPMPPRRSARDRRRTVPGEPQPTNQMTVEGGSPGRTRTCAPRLRRPDVGSVVPGRSYMWRRCPRQQAQFRSKTGDVPLRDSFPITDQSNDLRAADSSRRSRQVVSAVNRQQSLRLRSLVDLCLNRVANGPFRHRQIEADLEVQPELC
jgi:hypothetical protein